MYLAKKKEVLLSQILLQNPQINKVNRIDISDTKHIIQGIKDFAKVITSHVPDVEQHSKQVLNKPKLKNTEKLEAINHLEQKAYENMIKKRLNSDLDFKMMIQNINNPLMWGLSDSSKELKYRKYYGTTKQIKTRTPTNICQI